MNQLLSGRKVGTLTARHITTMGMLLAMCILLRFVPSFNYGNLVHIGVGFIGTAVTGAICGPWYAAVIAAANNTIGFFINGSGPFFPGYALSAALGGFIYGYFLWRRPKSLKNIFIAVLLVTLIVNLGFGSLWVKMIQDKAWSVFMPLRIYKNMVSCPLNTFILYSLFNIPTLKRLFSSSEF